MAQTLSPTIEHTSGLLLLALAAVRGGSVLFADVRETGPMRPGLKAFISAITPCVRYSGPGFIRFKKQHKTATQLTFCVSD